jgi:hypothetical protein
VPAKNPKARARKAAPRPPRPVHVYTWWLWSGRPTFDGVCEALASQYAVLDELLQPVLADERTIPAAARRARVAMVLTHLTSVAEDVVVAAHAEPGRAEPGRVVSIGSRGTDGAAPVPPPAPAPSGLDAVDWYRRPGTNRAAAARPAAAAGLGSVGALGTATAYLAARHRAATATAAAVIHSGEPGRVLGGPAAGLVLAEFAVTRLVEAVVHGLDLAEALGRPHVADPGAASLVSGFLAAVVDRGGSRPASAPIAVDAEGSLIALTGERRRARIPAVAWIQAASGRRPAEGVLPRTHAWLAAELPLAA